MDDQLSQIHQAQPIAGWHPTNEDDYDRLKGRTVVARDNQEVGTLCAVFHPPAELPNPRGAHYFLVESTKLHPRLNGRELYLSEELFQAIEPDRVVLAVPLDRLEGDLVRAPRNLIGWSRK